MASARILVVDDEPNARGALRTILTEEGYAVSEAGDGVEALAVLRTAGADVVLADVRMQRMDGLTLLREARESGIDAAFVVMTAFGSIEMAVEAMRAGAENFLVKPLDERAVLVVIEKALEKRHLVQEAASLRARVRERVHFDNIVGRQPGAARGVRGRPARGAHPGQRAHPRRVRDGQGAHRPGAARAVAPEGPSIRPGQLRRADRDAARVRALRSRAGRLHRRGHPARGPLRAGRRRARSSSTRSATSPRRCR